MILLEKNEHHKAIKPLTGIEINNFFARSVAENHVNGKIFVDNADNPKTFFIVHPYGMSLLFGETDIDAFNAWLIDYCINNNKVRDKNIGLQVYPESWNEKFSLLFKNNIRRYNDFLNDDNPKRIIEYTRVNFKFNRESYINFRLKHNHDNFCIVRTDKELFNTIHGNVAPEFFWDNTDDFSKHGIGFTLIHEDKPASTAFASFVHDNFLEIGIETAENFRERGFASFACSALIDHCLDNNIEPVWSCRQNNAGSMNLAVKLGFVPVRYIPFYSLPV